MVSKRKRINAIIKSELRPKIEQLRSSLSEYTMSLNQYKAKEMIETFSNVLIAEYQISQMDETKPFHFDAKAKFQEVFQKNLDEELKELLEICNYQNFTGVYFDIDAYDVVVNGHIKKSQGQGFRAFLNTILAIALQNVIAKSNLHQICFMVIDSPILSLKEKDDKNKDEYASDTMKAGLFQYLLNHQSTRQMIIIENEIPMLDYTSANLIEFTKDENSGRYGLIEGYTE